MVCAYSPSNDWLICGNSMPRPVELIIWVEMKVDLITVLPTFGKRGFFYQLPTRIEEPIPQSLQIFYHLNREAG